MNYTGQPLSPAPNYTIRQNGQHIAEIQYSPVNQYIPMNQPVNQYIPMNQPVNQYPLTTQNQCVVVAQFPQHQMNYPNYPSTPNCIQMSPINYSKTMREPSFINWIVLSPIALIASTFLAMTVLQFTLAGIYSFSGLFDEMMIVLPLKLVIWWNYIADILNEWFEKVFNIAKMQPYQCGELNSNVYQIFGFFYPDSLMRSSLLGAIFLFISLVFHMIGIFIGLIG